MVTPQSLSYGIPDAYWELGEPLELVEWTWRMVLQEIQLACRICFDREGEKKSRQEKELRKSEAPVMRREFVEEIKEAAKRPMRYLSWY